MADDSPRVALNDLSDAQRHRLVESCMAYANQQAVRYYGLVGRRFGVGYEDLFSAAQMGLFEASRRYDDNKMPARGGNPFLVYAQWWVRCYIRREINQHRWFGTSRGGHHDDSYKPFPNRISRPIRNHKGPSDQHELQRIEVLAVTTETPADRAASNDGWDRLMRLVTPREKLVLEMMYVRHHTPVEVAAVLRVSKQRVHQLLAFAKARLTRKLLVKELPVPKRCGPNRLAQKRRIRSLRLQEEARCA